MSPRPPSQHAVFSAAIAEPPVTMQRKKETTKSSPALKLTSTQPQKDQVALRPNFFPEPHDPPLRDSDHFASFTIQSFGAVPRSLVPAKHRSINTTLPSPEKEVVHDVAEADAPLQPPLFIFVLTDNSIQIFDPGGTLTIVVGSTARCRQIQSLSSVTFIFRSYGIISFISGPRSFCSFTPVRSITSTITVFDPGGDQSSPAANSGGSHHIFSLLWLPWDRGKKSCSEAVFVFAELQCRAFCLFVWVL
ncbi:hypothetical protein L195_g006676 [Trifolium pratense]|uniref:Uncharacterized protein n=1 Tax=Trifolium pratense TaxID=57577 RepID=A0A2K3P492_TRIPR|nr:hypothetical protein L195_g006676 [Trifolium pratense]